MERDYVRTCNGHLVRYREEYTPAVGFWTVLDPISNVVSSVDGFFACSKGHVSVGPADNGGLVDCWDQRVVAKEGGDTHATRGHRRDWQPGRCPSADPDIPLRSQTICVNKGIMLSSS